jgi:hypothetical protein
VAKGEWSFGAEGKQVAEKGGKREGLRVRNGRPGKAAGCGGKKIRRIVDASPSERVLSAQKKDNRLHR